jgi:DNA invertase Pin-like site-specific DNA recombinase
MKSNKQTETAYIYLRMGTRQQFGSEKSIQVQKEKLKNYCRCNDVRVVDVFIDCPASANNFNRDGLIRMLGRNVIRPVNYIVATDMDRISRNHSEYLNLSRQLSKLDTQFEFFNGQDSKNMDEILKIIEVFEQNLNERMLKGKGGR